jgi:YesN/AraC family two-component response regulator
MKGNIFIESKPGVGTEISLHLPIVQSQKIVQQSHLKPHCELNDKPLNPEANSVKTPKFKDIKILIIEDNSSIRALLTQQLNNFNTITAKDGQEGIDLALKLIPDIIISDVMMPNKSGFDLCKAIKSNVATSHIPVVLLTAKADQQSKIEGLTQKADAYIYKPYHAEELLLVVRNLIESRKALQDIYSNAIATTVSSSFPKEDQFITSVKNTALENISDPDFTIDDLCKVLKLSRAGLHNKIKALTGLSTSHYINRIKMHKAKELLEDQNINVTEVSYQIGMKSLAYFSTLFRKEFGMSPKEYKDKTAIK